MMVNLDIVARETRIIQNLFARDDGRCDCGGGLFS
jgi:hypothetical protein